MNGSIAYDRPLSEAAEFKSYGVSCHMLRGSLRRLVSLNNNCMNVVVAGEKIAGVRSSQVRKYS